MDSKRKYNAKILLFGEYTTLLGGAALALPEAKLCGKWSFDPAAEDRLSLLLPKMRQLSNLNFDFDQFEVDLAKGLVFDSNIPEGYGTGSSGALTAALFDQYVAHQSLELEALKGTLSEIEGMFHGKSSGMDPLISFLNCPIIKHQSGQLEMIMNELPLEGIEYDLVDSGKPRETAPLVNDFLNRIESDEAFKTAMVQLSNLNNQAIEQLLTNQLTDFKQTVFKISELQFEQLGFLIPDHIRSEWEASLKDQKLTYKLCGAGGGGYFLRFHLF